MSINRGRLGGVQLNEALEAEGENNRLEKLVLRLADWYAACHTTARWGRLQLPSPAFRSAPPYYSLPSRSPALLHALLQIDAAQRERQPKEQERDALQR